MGISYLFHWLVSLFHRQRREGEVISFEDLTSAVVVVMSSLACPLPVGGDGDGDGDGEGVLSEMQNKPMVASWKSEGHGGGGF